MGVDFPEAQPPPAKSWADIHTPGSPRVPASQPSASCPQPPLVPDHELLRKIGGGSYGEVWLARSALGSYRAVKIVHRTTFEHDRPFEREFSGIQKFEPISRSHEGLVDLLQVGRNQVEGYFYYVMELADDAGAERSDGVLECWSNAKGQGTLRLDPASHHSSTPPLQGLVSYAPRTLRSELTARGRLPVAECIVIGLSLTSALDHLHRHKLVHRDVKPANIIFVGGVPKLADVGLVAEVSEARSYVGTEGYIPPEGPGTVQADIYSLGKLLYEINTGKDRHAFPELASDLAEQPDAQLLVELNAVLVKACQPDSHSRYESARAMHAELLLLQRGRSVRRKRSIERRFAAAKRISIVLTVIMILAALVFFLGAVRFDKVPNSEAARLHQRGRWYLNQVTDESLKKALEYVSRAIEIDPNYSPAYVTLFEIYCWNVGDLSDTEKAQKLRDIGEKLQALKPRHAAGHAALAYAKYIEGASDEAEKEMRLALQIDPNYANAHSIFGFWLSMQGRAEEARRELARAQELEHVQELELGLPSRITATVAGFPFMVARDYDGAIAQFKKALELETNFALAHNWIGRALEAKGDYLAALDEYEKCDLLDGAEQPRITSQFQALRQACTYTNGYWLKLKDLVEGASAKGKTLTEEDRWPLAGIYARLRMKEEAMALLESQYEAGKREVFFNLDPSYDGLRRDTRFEAIQKRMGLAK